MKLKLFSVLISASLVTACGTGDTSDEHKDSANTLQDTFPAGQFKDSMPADSNPPDATHVDSIHKIPR